MENVTNCSSQKIGNLSDSELFNLCCEYGSESKKWMRKFSVLLPEVLKRDLYRKKGFCSVYEFAAKVAGMNRDTVDRVLKLNSELGDKPVLRALIEKEGWSKVRVVASVATKETERFWAEKVRILPKSALETYAKEVREKLVSKSEIGNMNGSANNSEITLFDCTAAGLTDVPGDGIAENWTNLSIKLDKETEFRLRLLRQKIERQKHQKITYNELLGEMLNMIDEIVDEKQSEKSVIMDKENCGVKCEETDMGNGTDKKNKSGISRPATRHVPLAIKRKIWEKYRGHCSCPGCNKPATNIHHLRRFATKMYNPHCFENLRPLCDNHHILEHSKMAEPCVDLVVMEFKKASK